MGCDGKTHARFAALNLVVRPHEGRIMMSEGAKRAIDELSKDNLRLEVEKRHRSRYQGDNFAYAQTRLKQLEEEDQTGQHQAQLAVAADANEIHGQPT